MIQKLQIADYTCDGVACTTSPKVAYMIYPDAAVFPSGWLEDMSAKCKASIVAVYVPLNKWNDDLTPWPEPPEAKDFQPFGGDAAQFYTALSSKIIPEAEKALALTGITERDLVGVSLAGLFTLWQWMQFDTFTSVGCLSGSFWYEGFLSWFESRDIPQKAGQAYFLLGTDEPKAKVKAYRTVGVNTEAVAERLKSAGIDCHFDRVPGNHFANPLPRAEKALAHLFL